MQRLVLTFIDEQNLILMIVFHDSYITYTSISATKHRTRCGKKSVEI